MVPPVAIVSDGVNVTVNTGFDPLFTGLALVVTVEIWPAKELAFFLGALRTFFLFENNYIHLYIYITI